MPVLRAAHWRERRCSAKEVFRGRGRGGLVGLVTSGSRGWDGCWGFDPLLLLGFSRSEQQMRKMAVGRDRTFPLTACVFFEPRLGVYYGGQRLLRLICVRLGFASGVPGRRVFMKG